MFKWFKRVPDSGFTTLVGADAVFNGTISFAGTLQIDGTVNGNIEGDITQKANLVVTAGRVVGDVVRTLDAYINTPFQVKELFVEGLLKIGPNAQLKDITIYVRHMEIKEGAYLHNCKFVQLDESSKGEVV